jgi:hypoxanthine phosphoribosyltransferase
VTVPERVLEARRTGELLFPADKVIAAIDRLAVRLTVAYAQADPVLLCVLNGGLPFTAALMQRLQFPLELSYVHVGRYGESTRGGELDWHAKPQIPLTDRQVLLVDDIVDEGVTLNALADWCRSEGACEVTSVALLDKDFRNGPQADYAALSCPDRYVFGWGMDFEGYWRNLPEIYALAGHLETTG